MPKPKSNPAPPATEPAKPSEFELVVETTNALVVVDERKAELAAALKPIITRIDGYKKYVATLKVTNQKEADAVAVQLKQMKDDDTLAQTVMAREIDGLFAAHRRWTGFRNLFTVPLQETYRKGKNAVIAWQVEEQKKRDAEQARRQAEADERARKEQERLRKQAEAAAAKGQTEKAEEKQAAAEAVVAPTIVMPEAKVSGVTIQERWTVKCDEDGEPVVDHAAFFAAAATDQNLWAYVQFRKGKLQSAKAANPRLEIPGVQFAKENR